VFATHFDFGPDTLIQHRGAPEKRDVAVQLRNAQFIAKAFSFEGQANGLATRCSIRCALAAGLFRTPWAFGAQGGGGWVCLAEEYFVVLQHTA
jgi:hypothetical protein